MKIEFDYDLTFWNLFPAITIDSSKKCPGVYVGWLCFGWLFTKYNKYL